MSLFAEKLYGQLAWDDFTLSELREIFQVENEPVFQDAVSLLINSGLVKITLLVDGEPILTRI